MVEIKNQTEKELEILKKNIQELGLEKTPRMDQIIDLGHEVHDHFELQLEAVESVLTKMKILLPKEPTESDAENDQLFTVNSTPKSVARSPSPCFDTLGISNLSLDLLYTTKGNSPKSSPIAPVQSQFNQLFVSNKEFQSLDISIKNAIPFDYLIKFTNEINDLITEKKFFNSKLEFTFEEIVDFCMFDSVRIEKCLQGLTYLGKLELSAGIYKLIN
jgi:hypothetical protein